MIVCILQETGLHLHVCLYIDETFAFFLFPGPKCASLRTGEIIHQRIHAGRTAEFCTVAQQELLIISPCKGKLLNANHLMVITCMHVCLFVCVRDSQHLRMRSTGGVSAESAARLDWKEILILNLFAYNQCWQVFYYQLIPVCDLTTQI